MKKKQDYLFGSAQERDAAPVTGSQRRHWCQKRRHRSSYFGDLHGLQIRRVLHYEVLRVANDKFSWRISRESAELV